MTENNQTWQQNSPFPDYSHEDWLDKIEPKPDEGNATESLLATTLDGFEVQPIYQQKRDAPFYTRGDLPWSIQQTYSTVDLSETNRTILSDLTGGLTSVELALAPRQTDTPASVCSTVDSLELLLKDVQPQMIHISLTPCAQNLLTGPLLLAYYYRKKITPNQIDCALNIDPLYTLASTGRIAVNALDNLQDVVNHSAINFPASTSVCIDTSIYHNGGCTPAQELSCLMASTVEYLRSLQTLDVDTVFAQLRYRISLDNDYFANIAKLRAARELIKKIKTHCGAKDSHILIDAVSSRRSQTSLDPEVNILRSTTQATAAIAGGANGFNCAPYDQLCNPTAKAARLARNTHHILAEESGLLNIHDPARGSGYVEALTTNLCLSAWPLFQKIESDGGMYQSLINGSIQSQTDTSRQLRANAMATGAAGMVGVTDYPNLQEEICQPVCLRQSASWEDEEQTQTQPPSVTALIGTFAEGASINDFRHHYTAVALCPPIDLYRDAEVFENLRWRSQQFKKTHGHSPRVTVITIGEQKDYAARLSFCRNFFAIAGIETVAQAPADPAHNHTIAVLCSSDTKYLAQAQDICAELHCENLWLAGNSKQVTDHLQPQNIKETIHLHSNRVQLLDTALSVLGA